VSVFIKSSDLRNLEPDDEAAGPSDTEVDEEEGAELDMVN
jgi:hypothetical protein